MQGLKDSARAVLMLAGAPVAPVRSQTMSKHARIYAVIRWCVFASWVLAPGFAASAELQEQALDVKIQESRVIFLATVKAVREADARDDFFEYALLNVDRSVKGQAVPAEVRLITKGRITEDDPACCTVGTRLFVFASPQGNALEATNGHYGVFVLDGNRVLYWPHGEGDTWARLEDVIREISAHGEGKQALR